MMDSKKRKPILSDCESHSAARGSFVKINTVSFIADRLSFTKDIVNVAKFQQFYMGQIKIHWEHK